jgi:hypothetical protein
LDTIAILTGLSLGSLGSAGGLVWAASRVPAQAATLERWGGALLVAGLALLGAALHQFAAAN